MPAFDQAAIEATIPNLVQQAIQIKEITEKLSTNSPSPLSTPFLPKLPVAYACKCGKAYATEASYDAHCNVFAGTGNAKKHNTFEQRVAQTLGHDSYSWFPVADDIEDSPPSDSLRRKIRAALQKEFKDQSPLVPFPSDPPSVCKQEERTIFDTAGWTQILDSFGPGYTRRMRQHTHFSPGDPLLLLRAFVSTYFAMVAAEAAAPELLPIACSVRAGNIVPKYIELRRLGALGRQKTHNDYALHYSRFFLFIMNCANMTTEKRGFQLSTTVIQLATELKDALISANGMIPHGHSPHSTVPTDGTQDYESESDDGELDSDSGDSDPGLGDDTTEHAPNADTSRTPSAVRSSTNSEYQLEAFIFHETHPHDAIVIPLLHRLAFTLFKSKTSINHLGDPFITFTVLDHTDDSDSFRAIGKLPPALVRMKYGMRITFFHEIAKAWRNAGGSQSFAQISPKYLVWISKTDASTVFGWNHTMLHRISPIARKLPTRERFVPCDGTGSIFWFDNHLIDFKHVPILAQAMLGTLERGMLEIFDGVNITPEELPNLQDVVDDRTCKLPPGTSIFTDPTKNLHSYRTLWLDKLVATGQYVDHSGPEVVYNEEAWMRLSKMIAEFTSLLFACDHILNGGVSRGTSISETTYADSSRGPRTWGLADGRGLIHSAYSKTSNNLGFDLQSARSQCYRLSYITFLYLLLIRPVDTGITLLFKLRPTVAPEHIDYLSRTYMYYATGRVLDTGDLTKILLFWTKKYLHVALGTAAVRQMWSFCKDQFVADTDLADTCEILQHGVEGLEAPAIRSGDYPTPEESQDWFIKISQAYHKAFGIAQERVFDIENRRHYEIPAVPKPPSEAEQLSKTTFVAIDSTRSVSIL